MSPGGARGRAMRETGFTLVEIAVVIVVLSLLLAMIAGIGTAMVGQQRREATRQRLAGVETAIALFASQNLRLPCPADGRLAGTNANAGLEQFAAGACNVGGVAGSQQHGVLPWRALGLSEQDATDGWGNRLTYRVHSDFVAAPAMNLTFCDPGGTKTPRQALASPGGYCDPACTAATFPAGCTMPSAVTANAGIEVRNLAGSRIMDPALNPSTGAAYVVVSHGENGKGAYNAQGTLQGSGWVGGVEDEERKNDASLAIAAHYIDDFFVDSGAVHFDDFVLRPSILTVATKAQLGPRAH